MLRTFNFVLPLPMDKLIIIIIIACLYNNHIAIMMVIL